jgi:hypothetical protein
LAAVAVPALPPPPIPPSPQPCFAVLDSLEVQSSPEDAGSLSGEAWCEKREGVSRQQEVEKRARDAAREIASFAWRSSKRENKTEKIKGRRCSPCRPLDFDPL